MAGVVGLEQDALEILLVLLQRKALEHRCRASTKGQGRWVAMVTTRCCCIEEPTGAARARRGRTAGLCLNPPLYSASDISRRS